LVSWNVGGWTPVNDSLRRSVLLHFKADIICVNETHLTDGKLSNGDPLFLEGYTFYDHSRKIRHFRAPHNFGGVGCFVKNDFSCDFTIEHDKSYDGIQVLKFVHKSNDYCFVIINVYLPPCNSVYGRDATGFMAHMLTLIYHYSEYDAIYLMGDLNSRIGAMQDFVSGIDHVKARNVLDHSCNKHGEVFIDYLIESQMIVLNGRFDPHCDNFTRVHTTGSSVVDYICTFHDNLKNCHNFRVHLTTDLMSELKLQGNRYPDHSLLEFDFLFSFVNTSPVCNPSELVNTQPACNPPLMPNIPISNVVNASSDTHRYLNCNNGRKLPVNFLESDLARQALLQCITDVENARNKKTAIEEM